MNASPAETTGSRVLRVDAQLYLACRRWLNGHPPRSARASLEALAGSAPDEPCDLYGEGKIVDRLTSRVAVLTGKETAVFAIKGTIAQQAILRAHADFLERDTVVVHPQSHIACDEDRALEVVHHLKLTELGRPNQAFTADDLAALRKPPSSVVVELPLRRGDYALPTWDQLAAIAEWARQHGARVHFDAARLWECQPYYARSLAHICALADTTYLSTYKILGGWSGAVLAGSVADLERAGVWLNRLGARPRLMAPCALSASVGLDRHLPKMAGYVRRAQTLAAALQSLPGIRIAPANPETNYFCVYFTAPAERLRDAADELARTERLGSFAAFEPLHFRECAEGAGALLQQGARARTDVCIGESAEAWTDEEIVATVARLLELAR